MIKQHGKELVKAEQKFRQLREKLGRVENKYYGSLNKVKKEFAKIVSEIVKELGYE